MMRLRVSQTRQKMNTLAGNYAPELIIQKDISTMKRPLTSILCLICLTVVGCETYGNSPPFQARVDNRKDWTEIAAMNRGKLNSLNTGMSRQNVLSTMGTTRIRTYSESNRYSTNPHRTVQYSAKGKKIEILYYYTQMLHNDSRTTDDELTPLVLIENSLSGWGWEYLENNIHEYGISKLR